jgi:hypothetical protein
LPIYPPCPSLSGRGLEARPFRLGGTPSFPAKQDARPQVSPLERGDAVLNNVKYPGEGGPSHPLFLSFSLWRGDSGLWRSCRATQSSAWAQSPSRASRGAASRTVMRRRGARRESDNRPDAKHRRQPQRVQPGDANAVSECRLVRLFPSPFWPVKKGTPHEEPAPTVSAETGASATSEAHRSPSIKKRASHRPVASTPRDTNPQQS